jgi:hypothetical protein
MPSPVDWPRSASIDGIESWDGQCSSAATFVSSPPGSVSIPRANPLVWYAGLYRVSDCNGGFSSAGTEYWEGLLVLSSPGSIWCSGLYSICGGVVSAAGLLASAGATGSYLCYIHPQWQQRCTTSTRKTVPQIRTTDGTGYPQGSART